MWWQQFVKEARGHRGETLLLAAVLVVWTAFLYSRAGVWAPELVVGVYWAPAGFLPLWAIWTSVQLYRQEWRENTSYLMLSLPVRAWTITSAKLAVIAAGIAGFSALLAAGAWILVARTGILRQAGLAGVFEVVPLAWFVKTAVAVWLGGAFGILVLSLFAQCAYVFSRLFSRFQGLAMLWLWFLIFWAMSRAVEIGGRLLSWLPEIRVQALHVMNGIPGSQNLAVESGPIAALVLFSLALYWLLNVAIERAVEV